jgi:hypothetical protein
MSWKIGSHIVCVDAQDEVKLYDSAEGQFHALNRTGSAIWQRLMDDEDVDVVVGRLADEFGARDDSQRRQVATAVTEFVADIVARGFVVEVSEATSPT